MVFPLSSTTFSFQTRGGGVASTPPVCVRVMKIDVCGRGLKGTPDNFCPASLAYFITCTGSCSLLSEVLYLNANSGKTLCAMAHLCFVAHCKWYYFSWAGFLIGWLIRSEMGIYPFKSWMKGYWFQIGNLFYRFFGVIMNRIEYDVKRWYKWSKSQYK